MQTKTKLRDRVISALLVLVMAVGMIPFGIIDAEAAGTYQNITEAIKGEGGRIDLNVTLQNSYGTAGTIVGTSGETIAQYLGVYSGLGLNGWGYCAHHGRRATYGMSVNVLESYKVRDPLVINTYFEGYTDSGRDVSYFRESLWPEVQEETGYNAEGVDMSGLTDLEWRKATQMAIWMALGQLSIDRSKAYRGGTIVSDYNTSANDRIITTYGTNYSSPSQQRQIQAAIIIHLKATWLQDKGLSMGQRTPGSTTRPVEYDEFKANEFYPVSATVDFTNANGEGTGNIADAYDKMNPVPGDEIGIHKQTIDGTEYYVIYWMYNSKTQAGKAWSDVTLSGNMPEGTTIKPLNEELDAAFAEKYSLYDNPQKTGTGDDWYKWYFDTNGYRVNQETGEHEFSPVPTTAPIGGLIEDIDTNAAQPNRESWPNFFKVCIPVDSVAAGDGSSAEIKINMKNDSVMKYDCYQASNNNSGWQGYIMGDITSSVESTGIIRWGEQLEPDQSYFTIYKKDSNGKVLQGAEFTASCNEMSKTITATTDASGKATFTIPDGYVTLEDGTTYTTWSVKETKAPDGYDLIDQTITVTAKAGNSGTYEMENEATPPEDQPGTPSEVLKKVDAETKEGLAGAEFRFSSTETGYNATFITDSFGTIQLQWVDEEKANYIAPGTYMVEEIVPPQGYNLDSDGPQQITLYYDGDKAWTSGSLVFNNSKKPSIVIYKIDENGEHLNGAYFDVYKDGAKIDSIGPTEDGKIEYFGPDGDGVENGLYRFEETAAPEGYLLSTEPMEINVDIDNLNTQQVAGTLTFVNYKTPTIQIEKKDAQTGAYLPNAVFKVTIDGEDLGTYTTDDAGRIAISEETYGKYLDEGKDSWTITVEEIEAPPGFLLPADPVQTLELHRGETLKTFTFVDDAYPEIKIQKVDAETGEPLAGAGFRIMIDGEVFRDNVLTDDNGEIVISYDEFKDFLDDDNKDSWTIYVEEVTPPDGYLLPVDRVQEQELHQGESLEPFTFRDTKYPYIEIQKHDAETGEPLAGAQFTVEIDGHQLAGPFVSDEDGIIRIDYEQYKHFLGEETDPDKTWTITVTEVTAPEDYNRDPVDTNGWTMTASLTMGEQLPPFIFDDTSYRDIKVTGISA